jgi:putative ABC transport system permease protein
MALGARRFDIINMTLREALKLTGAGILIGIVIAYGAGKLLESLLAGVNPWDLETVLMAISVTLVMTFAGSLPPALSASRIDPTIAMRP